MAIETMQQFLDAAGSRADPQRLKNELKICDNWVILLFGDQKELFKKIAAAYRGQPPESGLAYSYQHTFDGPASGLQGYHELYQVFRYTAESKALVTVQVGGEHDNEWEGPDHQIGGLENTVHISFHPYGEDVASGAKILSQIAKGTPEGIYALMNLCVDL